MRFALIVAGVVLAIALSGCGGRDCPRGQHSERSGFIPVFVGKGVVMVPRYECKQGEE